MAQLHFTLDSDFFVGLFSETKDAKNEILNSTTTFGGGIYSRTVKVYSFI